MKSYVYVHARSYKKKSHKNFNNEKNWKFCWQGSGVVRSNSWPTYCLFKKYLQMATNKFFKYLFSIIVSKWKKMKCREAREYAK